MFNLIYKITLYVNFNKHKVNYVICSIKDLITKKRIYSYTHGGY